MLTEDDLGLPLFLPPHPELCDYRHALLCWEWNPGLQVSWASILPTELHLQPQVPKSTHTAGRLHPRFQWSVQAASPFVSAGEWFSGRGLHVHVIGLLCHPGKDAPREGCNPNTVYMNPLLDSDGTLTSQRIRPEGGSTRKQSSGKRR